MKMDHDTQSTPLLEVVYHL